jgi:hypothetical protein
LICVRYFALERGDLDFRLALQFHKSGLKLVSLRDRRFQRFGIYLVFGVENLMPGVRLRRRRRNE